MMGREWMGGGVLWGLWGEEGRGVMGAVKEGGDRLTWAGNPTRPVQLRRGRSAKNKRWVEEGSFFC